MAESSLCLARDLDNIGTRFAPAAGESTIPAPSDHANAVRGDDVNKFGKVRETQGKSQEKKMEI